MPSSFIPICLQDCPGFSFKNRPNKPVLTLMGGGSPLALKTRWQIFGQPFSALVGSATRKATATKQIAVNAFLVIVIES